MTPIPTRVQAVTPDDATDLSTYANRYVYVGGAGNLAIVDARGAATTLAVVAGAVLPIQVAKIKNTGTSATGIALFLP